MIDEAPVVRKANKGEWSEIYTFFKLLVDGSLPGADENLNPDPAKNFSVLKIIRDEKNKKTIIRKTYDLTEKTNKAIISNNQDSSVSVVDLSVLRNGVKQIFNTIRDSKGRSFVLPEAQFFMRELSCSMIKAKSTDKSDIRLVMQDRFSPTETESGFSIKTAYRSSPTLLNASKKNTSFVYEVVEGTQEKKPVEITTKRKKVGVRDRVVSIYGSGSLKFKGLDSGVFQKNLELIDGTLPEILAVMLACYHSGKGSKVSELVALLPNAPEFKDLHRDEDFYKYKIKQLLETIALGMTPGKVWDGATQANGGFIVVRDDGELVCYHLYDRAKFLDYLFSHTRFDTPSTTRHKYGSIETSDDGKKIMRLNIQIRFI